MILPFQKNTPASHGARMLATTTLMLLAGVVSPTQAATLVYSTTAPSVSGDDISNFTGSTNDAGNVAVVSGDADAGTYLAHDRGSIGQTFTTGSNLDGYTLTALSLQQVTYSAWADTNNASSTLTVRVGTFSGTTLTPTNTETISLTGGEANQPANGGPVVGNGNYLTVSLSTPIILAANTTYFFDLAVTGGTSYYFETNGTSVVATYSGGTAFHTARLGGNFSGGTTTLVADTGDHVFVASMTAIPSAIPEPSTYAIVAGALALAGTIVQRRRARRTA